MANLPAEFRNHDLPKNEEVIVKSVGQDMSCTGVVNQL